jgi:hypothetical protein
LWRINNAPHKCKKQFERTIIVHIICELEKRFIAVRTAIQTARRPMAL